MEGLLSLRLLGLWLFLSSADSPLTAKAIAHLLNSYICEAVDPQTKAQVPGNAQLVSGTCKSFL